MMAKGLVFKFKYLHKHPTLDHSHSLFNPVSLTCNSPSESNRSIPSEPFA